MRPGGIGDGAFLDLTFADGSTSQTTLAIPGTATGEFFGFVADTAVTSFRINSHATGTEEFAIEHLRFRGQQTWGQPFKWWVLAALGALVAIAVVFRKRQP